MRRLPLARLLGLVAAAALVGCGGDDQPTRVDEGAQDAEMAEARALADVLVQSMQQAFFASLVQDPVTVQGQSGTLQISGQTWTFQDYSPNGQLFMTGQLEVPKTSFPNIPVKGELVLSGSTEGTMIVDMVVSPQLGQGATVTATGTLRLGDQVWDVAELMAAAED